MDTSQPPDPNAPPPPPPPPAGAPVAGSGSYQRPADYYSAPPAPAERKGCPRWLLFGCGGLGLLALLILVAFGFWMARGGGAKVIGWAVTQLEKEADQMYEADVPPDERARLQENLTTLRQYIDEDRVEIVALQPILSDIQAAMRDQRLTRQEVESLNERIEQLNEEIASQPVSVRGWEPRAALQAA